MHACRTTPIESDKNERCDLLPVAQIHDDEKDDEEHGEPDELQDHKLRRRGVVEAQEPAHHVKDGGPKKCPVVMEQGLCLFRDVLVKKEDVEGYGTEKADTYVDARHANVSTVKEIDIEVEGDAETEEYQGKPGQRLIRCKVSHKDYSDEERGDGKNRSKFVIDQENGNDDRDHAEHKDKGRFEIRVLNKSCRLSVIHGFTALDLLKAAKEKRSTATLRAVYIWLQG